jgi:hypothetical protein
MTTDTTTRFNYARLAGLVYVSLAVLGGFAQFGARETLIVDGDAAATAASLLEHEMQFRLGAIADLLLIVLDGVLALAFWRLFKPVHRDLALLALILNVARMPMMGANLVFHIGAIMALQPGALSAFTPEQAQSLALFMADLHAAGYTASGIFFGAWCFTIGLLIWRSNFLPKLIGILMMLALPAYWGDLLLSFLAPDWQAPWVAMVVLPAAVAEISLALWLALMSGRVHRRSIVAA